MTLKNLDETEQVRLWERRLAVEERRTRWTFVAENPAQQMVAYATGRLNRTEFDDYEIELHQLYVLPQAQRQKLGVRLVQRLAQHLDSTGYESMLVWVMTINPATVFYRDTLCGTVLGERIIPDGDGNLQEAAYGWLDIGKLKTSGED